MLSSSARAFDALLRSSLSGTAQGIPLVISPAVVVGMVYALLQFMILSVYSSAEKMDWSLVEAARDLGATPLKAFLTVTLKLT